MRAASFLRKSVTIALVAFAALTTASCGMMIHHLKHGFRGAPPASEFGLGPRTTAAGRYSATVQVDKPLAVGPLQTVRLRLVDVNGQAVRDARVVVGGGMPQHGHGLPTKPRVTGMDGDGAYVVEGLRFNMGGWWELKFAILGASDSDSVTFNVRL